MLVYIQRPGTGSLYRTTEPMGLKTLAAFIESKGYSAIVFFGSAHEAFSEVKKEMEEYGLDAAGLYCDYENQSVVESFSSLIKEKFGLRVFVGGPQAIALGEDFFRNSRCDSVVKGEGEEPLYELLEFFLHGRGSMENIAGSSYLNEKGEIITLPPRPPISNLDDLPVREPGRDIYSQKNKRSLAIITGRGCPFRCAFCYEGSVPGKVRLRSVKNVIEEIRQELEFNPHIKYIWIADDTFTLEPRRLEDFSAELAKLRKSYDFVWFCECHTSTLIKWPDIISLMIESGLVRMQIGIESGSSSVLEMYRKGTSPEEIEKFVGLCMEKGLPQLVGNVIIGGAGETHKTFEETKYFISGLMEGSPGMLDTGSSFLMPLPGTEITKNPSSFGITIIDRESLTSTGDIAVVRTENLSREDITSMKLNFSHHIYSSMMKIYREGALSEERIKNHLNLKVNYGVKSSWYRVIFSENKISEDYEELLSGGGVKLSRDIEPAELERWRPRRILNIWSSVDFTDGYPRAGKYVLSPLEYELLLHSTGKMKLGEVMQRVYDISGKYFDSYEDFRKTSLSLMKDFEERLWLVYTEI